MHASPFDITLAVIDALRIVARVQLVPMPGFIGINCAAQFDPIFQRRHRFVFRLRNEGDGLAVTLTRDDDNAALAVLMDGLAAIDRFSFSFAGLM